MPLDPHCARVLKMLSASSAPTAAQTPHQRRQGLRDLAALSAGEPIAIDRVEDLAITGDGHDIIVRRYTPGAKGGGPAVVYLHGGGWTAGGLDTHDGVCRALGAASGFSVFAVDYRLAPEHPYPAGLSDAIAATRWISANAEALGIDAARLVLAGDSAGGALAAAAAARLADTGATPIALLLLICPILDLVEERPSRREFAEGFFITRRAFAEDLASYLPPGADPGSPALSPLRAPSLAGLPPTHVHVAEFDPFRDEGEAFAARLSQDGIAARLTRHAGMIHYFYALPRLIPHARMALQDIGADLRASLG